MELCDGPVVGGVWGVELYLWRVSLERWFLGLGVFCLRANADFDSMDQARDWRCEK